MPVTISATPNPNAVKFTVGVDVGGPKTFVAGQPTDESPASALLDISGLASVFMTADFVTISKMPDASWDDIAPAAQEILSEHFGV